MKKAMVLVVGVLAIASLLMLGGCSLFGRWHLHNDSTYTVSVYLLIGNSFKDGTQDRNMKPGATEDLQNDEQPGLVWSPANLVDVSIDIGGKAVNFENK